MTIAGQDAFYIKLAKPRPSKVETEYKSGRLVDLAKTLKEADNTMPYLTELAKAAETLDEEHIRHLAEYEAHLVVCFLFEINEFAAIDYCVDIEQGFGRLRWREVNKQTPDLLQEVENDEDIEDSI